MELHLTLTIRIARTKPAATPAPSSTAYPMRAEARQSGFIRSARPKDVR